VPHGALKERDEAIARITELLKDNKTAAPLEKQLLYRMVYEPQKGMFKLIPDHLQLGHYVHDPEDDEGLVLDDGKCFMADGQQYRIGDFVYLMPECAPLSRSHA
jgi:hypothetical protein